MKALFKLKKKTLQMYFIVEKHFHSDISNKSLFSTCMYNFESI